MGEIRQKRPNNSPILNFNNRQSLNKKFSTHVGKSMIFKTFKNKQCIIPRNKVISGSPL